MKLRKLLSALLRECKEDNGCTYKQLHEATGCSLSSIRYALNGGENTGIDVFQKLLDYMQEDVEIHRIIESEGPW